MLHKQAILIQMDNAIVTPETLVLALQRVENYFSEFNYKKPPLPTDLEKLVPSNLLITREDGNSGEMKGNITFTSPSGKVLYRETWKMN